MAPFRKNLKIIVVLALLVVISIVIITVSFKDSEIFQNTRSRLSDFFAPVQERTFSVFQPVVGFFASIGDYTATVEKLRELEKENAELEKRYTESVNLSVENDALRRFLEMQTRKDHDTVVAKVIGYSNTDWYSEIIINKGKEEGILEEMAVIDNNGLIGTVIFSSDQTSRVRLLYDPNTSIGARVLSSRMLGIIVGSQENRVFLDYFPDDEMIFKGDTIITSEYSQLVPAEILIGRVKSITDSKGQAYRTIEIDPFVDFSSLEYVMVIKE